MLFPLEFLANFPAGNPVLNVLKAGKDVAGAKNLIAAVEEGEDLTPSRRLEVAKAPSLSSMPKKGLLG